jgi:Zn-finger nucleic acid-binding protein
MNPDYAAVTYIKCPVCTKLMNRVNFGTKSGVIVDRCRDHGVWLDGGELRHLFEWMKAGGKLLVQEREEQLRKESVREKEREQRNSAADWKATESSSFDTYGGTLRSSDPELFELVIKAIRWFT